jgi:hypothetical protein
LYCYHPPMSNFNTCIVWWRKQISLLEAHLRTRDAELSSLFSHLDQLIGLPGFSLKQGTSRDLGTTESEEGDDDDRHHYHHHGDRPKRRTDAKGKGRAAAQGKEELEAEVVALQNEVRLGP